VSSTSLRVSNCSSGVSMMRTDCRDGTFGTLLSPTGVQEPAYGAKNVTWQLNCDLGFLYYNNCQLSALVAIILVAVGSVVFVGFVTFLCICFGCCKCCFVKRKYFEHEDDVVSPCVGLSTRCAADERLCRSVAFASPVSASTRTSTSST
jgi:hypothetical protein